MQDYYLIISAGIPLNLITFTKVDYTTVTFRTVLSQPAFIERGGCFTLLMDIYVYENRTVSIVGVRQST
jgi:hypothetical protein